MKIELPIFTPDFVPAFRLDDDPAQRPFKLIQEVISRPWLPFLVPKCCRFQFLIRLRMADDVH